ncbi:MAG: hypothetical protein JOY64_00625 [Alphaproteobacteria bacterium]|nr:hypothetical protein [Alphaproteobacteria bacterium]
MGRANLASIPEFRKQPQRTRVRKGDLVQWTSHGVDQFESPRRVRDIRIHEGKEWAFVEGSATGVPLAELFVVPGDVSELPSRTKPLAPSETSPRSVSFWTPLAIGLIVAMLCVLMAGLLWREHGEDFAHDTDGLQGRSAIVAREREAALGPRSRDTQLVVAEQRRLVEAASTDKATQDQAIEDLRSALTAAEERSARYAKELQQERIFALALQDQLGALAESLGSPRPDLSSRAPADASPFGATPQETPSLVDPPPGATPQETPSLVDPPEVAAAISRPSFQRLMSRAVSLREQGNIAAARGILEHLADTGDGAALYALAETYDPEVLSAWGTLGTKPDVEKARQLYSRALVAGVQEATDRLKVLAH